MLVCIEVSVEVRGGSLSFSFRILERQFVSGAQRREKPLVVVTQNSFLLTFHNKNTRK